MHLEAEVEDTMIAEVAAADLAIIVAAAETRWKFQLGPDRSSTMRPRTATLRLTRARSPTSFRPKSVMRVW